MPSAGAAVPTGVGGGLARRRRRIRRKAARPKKSASGRRSPRSSDGGSGGPVSVRVAQEDRSDSEEVERVKGKG